MVVMYGGLEIERTYITAKGNSKTEITCIYISLFIYVYILYVYICIYIICIYIYIY